MFSWFPLRTWKNSGKAHFSSIVIQRSESPSIISCVIAGPLVFPRKNSFHASIHRSLPRSSECSKSPAQTTRSFFCSSAWIIVRCFPSARKSTGRVKLSMLYRKNARACKSGTTITGSFCGSPPVKSIRPPGILLLESGRYAGFSVSSTEQTLSESSIR